MGKGSKGTITVLHVSNTKDIEGYLVNYEENRIHTTKAEELHPEFDHDCIFSFQMVSTIPLIGRLINHFRKPIDVLIWREGKLKCEKLPKGEELFDPLTDKEKVKIVKRVMALGLERFKPLATWMFVILSILNIIILIFQILSMRGIRIV